MGHQSHRFNQGLSNEHTVKRVLMMRGQPLHRDGMLSVDGKELITGLSEIAHGILA